MDPLHSLTSLCDIQNRKMVGPHWQIVMFYIYAKFCNIDIRWLFVYV